MIVGWKAWFAGESRKVPVREFNSNKTLWEELPEDGMLGMVVFEDTTTAQGDNTRINYVGYDYYFRAEGLFECLYAVDIDSRERNVMEDIAARYTDPVVKRGKWVDNTTMKKVEDAVRESRKWR